MSKFEPKFPGDTPFAAAIRHGIEATTPAIDVYVVAEELGTRMFVGITALPELALITAEAAAAGKIDAYAVDELYAAYWSAGGRRVVDTRAASFKVQVSKLRQIARLGSEYGQRGVKLLRDAVAVHARVYKRTTVEYQDCYNALVSVARVQLERDKIISVRIMKREMRA